MSSFEVVLSRIFIWTISHYCLLKPGTFLFSEFHQIGCTSQVFDGISEKEHIALGCCTDFEEDGFLSGLILCFMFGWFFSANTLDFG